jgi:hypothetical protein
MWSMAGSPDDAPDAGTSAALARATVWVALAAVAVQTAVGAANELSLESSALNPDEEGSVFQLASAGVMAAAAAAAGAHAVLAPRRRFRFGALATILAAFAVDDLVAAHERAGDAVGGDVLGLPEHLAVRLWIPLLAPVLVTAFLLLVAEARRVGGAAGRVLWAGLAALVAGVAVEVAGAVTREPGFVDRVGGKPEAVRLLVEEGLELGGQLLVAGGLWVVVAADSSRPARRRGRART